MGVSENSVPLNPIVNDHYPVIKWLAIIGNINPTFSGPKPYVPWGNMMLQTVAIICLGNSTSNSLAPGRTPKHWIVYVPWARLGI